MHSTSLIVILAPIILQTFVPSQLHLTLTDTIGEVQFIWSTPSPTQSTYVRISEDSIWTYFEGESLLFKNGLNKWYSHKAKAQLHPNTHYKYQVGCKFEGFSETFEFKTPPDQSSSKILLFGDISLSGLGKTAWETIRSSYKQQEIDTILMLGDLAYDLFSQSSIQGDDFMDQIQSVVSHVPVMTVAGNHEKADNYYDYLTRFPMPNTGFYYTFTVGFVRFVALHTEAFLEEFEKVGPMMEFFRNTLNRTQDDRDKYPWVVVVAHRPVYCLKLFKSFSCGKEVEVIRNYLEDLMFEFHVDLYVNGHVHNYQRSRPVYQKMAGGFFDYAFKGYINPTCTVYVTSGAIGASHQNTKVSDADQSEIIDFASDAYSFGLLKSCNKTHLNWQQISNDARNIIDEFWIIKNDS